MKYDHISRQSEKVADYLQARDSFMYELSFKPQVTAELAQQAKRTRKQPDYIVSLASSQTSMPPCKEGIDAADKAAKQYYFESSPGLKAAHEKLKQLESRVQELIDLYAEFSESYDPDMLKYGNPFRLQNRCRNLLTGLSEEHIQFLKDSNPGLHPALTEFLDNFNNPDHKMQNALPSGANKDTSNYVGDILRFMSQVIYTTFEGYTVPGKPAVPSIMTTWTDAAKRELEVERAKVQDSNVLTKLIDERLKPQIATNLLNLHGITVTDQGRISTCHDTNTIIVTSAITGLAEGHEGKLLLQFSASWDAYKQFQQSDAFDNHFIDGPVSGAALERFIKNTILDGKEFNTEYARTLVKKAIGGILICIPENPLGTNLSPEERKALVDVIVKYDISPVILDEIYAVPGCKSLSTEPGMEGRCYVVSGTSKYMAHNDKFSFGYTDNPEFAEKVERFIPERKKLTASQAAGFAAFLENTPLSYYTTCEANHKQKSQLVTRTMERVNTELGMADAVTWLKTPETGRLGVITISPELTKKCGIRNSSEFAEYLYKVAGVEGLPIGDLNPHPNQRLGVRVNFSKDEATLIDIVERFGIAAKKMPEVHYSKVAGEASRGKSTHYEMGSFSSTPLSEILTRDGGVNIDSLLDLVSEIATQLVRGRT